MRNLAENEAQPTATTAEPQAERSVFSTTLSNGRVVKVREMLGSHFIYMETALRKHSNMKKMFFMVSKLSEGTGNPIFVEELEALVARDIKKISEIFSLAAGEEPDEDGEEGQEEEMEFPN